MALPPLPRPYQDTAEYWAAARDHHFIIQQCNSCGNYQFYPRGVCSHCLSSDLKWQCDRNLFAAWQLIATWN